MELEQRCRALVAELGLARAEDVRAVVPLTGGVASDIAMVDLGAKRICVKFALPKLKVAQDWHAPVHRNAAEFAWLKVAAGVSADSAVQLFGHSAESHGFAMEYLEGEDVYLWKDHLLSETPGRGEAAKVAALLGKIHAASTRRDFETGPFHNSDDFHALRIEPYLSATRKAHPALAGIIEPLEEMLYHSQAVLVHGDASPKNILFRRGAPILLDAECATLGDACFDPAFCLNHLILKAIHLPASRATYLAEALAFWQAYAPHATWEAAADIEARVCAVLPVLMLARVDGKSPVEYLSPKEQQTVRDIAIPLIQTPPKSLRQFVAEVADHFTGEDI